jgi:hypothetical protein
MNKSEQLRAAAALLNEMAQSLEVKEPRKVKVRLFRDPDSGKTCSIDEEWWKYHKHWKPVSDIVEIEVKDE